MQSQAAKSLEKLFLEKQEFYPQFSFCKFYEKYLQYNLSASISTTKSDGAIRQNKSQAKQKNLKSSRGNVKTGCIDLKKYLRKENDHFYLVFVDGVLQKGLSSFADVLEIQKPSQKFVKKVLKDKSLGLLSLAFSKNVYQLVLKKDLKIKKPLQILHFLTEKSSFFSAPVVFFELRENTAVQIVQEIINLGNSQDFIFTPYLYFQLEKMAFLDFIWLNLVQKGQEKNFWQNSFIRSFLDQKAHFNFSAVTQGGETEILDFQAFLQKRASLTLNALSVLKAKNKSYFHSLVRHQGSKSVSSQLYKSVLSDSSSFFVHGEIVMPNRTEDSDGSFLNRNLLLSSKAKVFSQPFLKISTDNVKAKHGSASAKLSDDELFYLKSRGIKEKQAKKALLKGFCREIQNVVKIKSIRKSIEKALYVDFEA